MIRISEATRSRTPMPQNVKGYFLNLIKVHLKETAEFGFMPWISMSLTPRLTREQVRRQAQIETWIQQTFKQSLKVNPNRQDIDQIKKRLTADKAQTQGDGNVNQQDLPRRWAALFSAFRLLSLTSAPRDIDKPKSPEEVLALAEEVCDAFYLVARPPAEHAAAKGTIGTAENMLRLALKIA